MYSEYKQKITFNNNSCQNKHYNFVSVTKNNINLPFIFYKIFALHIFYLVINYINDVPKVNKKI